MLADVITGVRPKPRRIFCYGGHGVGKSTWPSRAPKPIYLATEDGLDDIGVDRSPLIDDFGRFNSWLSDLLSQDHDYKTIVIDTADALERIIHKAVSTKHGKASIEEIGYGKGYSFALSAWEFVLKTLDQIRATKNMGVVILAHAKVTKFQDPDTDTYDRYEPDLHKSVSPLLQEWCDEVLFARYQVDTKVEEGGFGQKRIRALGSGKRVLHTCEMPTHLAKRRLELPDVLPLDWDAYAAAVKKATSTNGNIDGVVRNGSSKGGKVNG